MFTPKTDNELKSLLEPVRRQLQKQVLLHHVTQYGLWGAGGSALLLLVARFWPIPYYQWFVAALIPLALLAGGLVALRKKPTLLQSAQVADGNGLAQRVETAWEHRESTSSVAVMQREDALRHLRKNLPHIIESIRIWAGLQKKLYATGGLLVASLLLAILPNPQDGILAQMALEKQAIAQVEKEIEAIKQEAKASEGLSEAQKKRLEEMLEQAKKAVAKANDPAERLNALRAAEKQLEKLRAAEQSKAASLQSLQRSLGGQQSTKSLADALAKGDREALTAALAQMAKAMETLGEQERAELTRELEKAAEQLKKDAEAASSQELEEAAKQLAQAAQELAAGQDPQALAALEASMQQVLAEARQSQQAMLAAAQVAASLNQSQMTLASARAAAGNSGSAGGAAAGAAGAGQAVPAATTPGGSPAASGTGTAANANQAPPPANGSQGAGQGNGAGNGAGNGSGKGAGLGNGNSKGAGAGLGEGKHELVTVPSSRIGSDSGPTETVGGPLGAGPSQSQQSGNTQVTSGGTLPYEEVYGQYEQFARESMEKGSIPGDYQDIVKDYFSKIEP
ncbi:hypothetical protein M655_004295 [Brevibacillus sp. NSP2.1]|uniref:hypothetical protein n=1 Tax=Brevibacillus sp. NSP2.1 TaxID=3003229 RepID=UPI00041F17C9|nr:hypothetical protein [Brevibacillus sp. NSP2.1]QHZ54938.1 hypothetical protein M655_004295 [Brevibacillus sp. NSP2.1]